jgi:hypothetical protein
MKLTTQFHPVLRLRMCGAVPPLLYMSAQISTRDNFTFIFYIHTYSGNKIEMGRVT